MKFKVIHFYEDVDEKLVEEVESEHDTYDEAYDTAKKLNACVSSYERYYIDIEDNDKDKKFEPYPFDEEDYVGTKMSLEEFIDYCESAKITDDDGYACELIVDGYVVLEKEFSPSSALELKDDFFSLQEEKGKVEIVWINK